MNEEYPFWMAGSAYRIQLDQYSDGHPLGLDRQTAAGLSPELRGLFAGEITITGSSDWPALIVYPKELWTDLRSKVARLPSMNKAAREIQRRMLGMALCFDETESLRISNDQRDLAALSNDASIIMFDTGWAEIWGVESLELMAKNWAHQSLSEETYHS